MQNSSRSSLSQADDRPFVVPWVVALLMLILVGVLAAFGASSHYTGYSWMMGGFAGWGWMWGAGALMMAIPLVVVLVLLVVLSHPPPSPPIVMAAPPPPDPTAEVEMRYARGEIDAEQFRSTLEELRATR